MRGFLILFCTVALFAFTAAADAGSPCKGGVCTIPNVVAKTTIDVQVSAEVARPLASAICERERKPIVRTFARVAERDRKPVAKIVSVVRVRR